MLCTTSLRMDATNGKILELTVLKGELATLRSNAKVYKALGNSQVFFLSDKLTIKGETERKLKELMDSKKQSM